MLICIVHCNSIGEVPKSQMAWALFIYSAKTLRPRVKSPCPKTQEPMAKDLGAQVP